MIARDELREKKKETTPDQCTLELSEPPAKREEERRKKRETTGDWRKRKASRLC